MTRRTLRIIFSAALAAGALAACGDGGGTSTGSTTEATLFDDFFSSTRGSLGAGNDATGQETGAPCDPGATDCGTDPGDGGTGVVVEVPELVCERPYAAPSAATAPCQAFCAKVAGCLGHPEAVAACASDCRASLGGHEIDAASQLLACFTAAECDDIADWRGGGGGTNVAEPTPATDPASGGGSDSSEGSAGAGSESGGASEVPAERVPEEGVDTWTPNPIEVCIEGLFEGWGAQSLPAAKQAVCDAVAVAGDSCTSDSVSGSTGSGSASSDPDDGGSANDAAPPSEGAPEPIPPREEEETSSSSDEAECHAVATLLTQAALDRIAACAEESDCSARSECLVGELVCLPFLQSILGFDVSASQGGGTVEVDAPPVETEPTEPSPAPR